jgi:hypothetical protein
VSLGVGDPVAKVIVIEEELERTAKCPALKTAMGGGGRRGALVGGCVERGG